MFWNWWDWKASVLTNLTFVQVHIPMERIRKSSERCNKVNCSQPQTYLSLTYPFFLSFHRTRLSWYPLLENHSSKTFLGTFHLQRFCALKSYVASCVIEKGWLIMMKRENVLGSSVVILKCYYFRFVLVELRFPGWTCGGSTKGHYGVAVW